MRRRRTTEKSLVTMSSPKTGKRRIDTDVIKLIESKHQVTVKSDNLNDLIVKFHGPQDTPYEAGVWKVRVTLPDEYPFKSPSIGFLNKIYHPNIDEDTGVVCLDVINQKWSALYDLNNIFETFLPQLLTYPNSKDPMNPIAADLQLWKPVAYKKKVIDYVRRFATEMVVMEDFEDVEASSDSCSSVSDYDDDDDNEL